MGPRSPEPRRGAQGLLYGALVAASEKGSVAALADVLNVDMGRLCEALSVAIRLGFGHRLPPVHGARQHRINCVEAG